MATTDPRNIPGTLNIHADANQRNNAQIDVTNAILMDSAQVALVEPRNKDGVPLDRSPVWVLNLGGRINKSQDRAEINFVFDVDGAAAIITELMALAGRQGDGMVDALEECTDRRMEALVRAGNAGQG